MVNPPYTILTLAVRADRDVEATIHGPGFGPSGRRSIFATKDRVSDFVRALNVAYSEGVKDGYLEARLRQRENPPESSAN